MKNIFTNKRLCRAGVIAALYAVLTWALGSFAYGPLQIRPAEALCILPLFFPETVPALWIGCMLANLISGYGLYDIFLGSLATLAAAFLTYGAGRLAKNHILRVAVGGIFPVLFNAFLVPLIWILAGSTDIVYWYEFAVMLLNEGLWIYVLGIPLYIAVYRLRKKGVSVFTDGIAPKKVSTEQSTANCPPPPDETNDK